MKTKLKFLSTFFLIFFFAASVQAQSAKIITLKDGSQLKGIVTSLEDGTYTLETENLGPVSVHESNILSITSPEAAAISAGAAQLPSTSSQFKNQVQDMQGKVMTDPMLMKDIEGLTQDPEIMQMLQDKELMADILSYDPDRIENNPKLKKLMQNPKMKNLIEKVDEKNQ